MNQKTFGPKSPEKKLGKKSKVGGLAVLVLAGLYSIAAPQLNQRFGWNLPAVTADAAGNVQVAESRKETTPTKGAAKQASGQSDRTASKSSKPSGPLADLVRSNATKPSPSLTETNQDAANQDAAPETDTLLYGILKEVSRDRYLSPEGLRYTPGSAEGHRLKHLKRHTADMPSRPGKHGVFDGEMEGALKTIDRAYQRAKKNQKTTKSVDDGRTIYTVDMGGRVGYIGGRDGKRKRNPMARRVRLVVDGDRLITAYPM